MAMMGLWLQAQLRPSQKANTHLYLWCISELLRLLQYGEVTEVCGVDGQSHGRQALQVNHLNHRSSLCTMGRGLAYMGSLKAVEHICDAPPFHSPPPVKAFRVFRVVCMPSMQSFKMSGGVEHTAA